LKFKITAIGNNEQPRRNYYKLLRFATYSKFTSTLNVCHARAHVSYFYNNTHARRRTPYYILLYYNYVCTRCAGGTTLPPVRHLHNVQRNPLRLLFLSKKSRGARTRTYIYKRCIYRMIHLQACSPVAVILSFDRSSYFKLWFWKFPLIYFT